MSKPEMFDFAECFLLVMQCCQMYVKLTRHGLFLVGLRTELNY